MTPASCGPSLLDVQRFVVDVVRSADDTNEEATRRAEQILLPSVRGLTPKDRLEIYREQYWTRHVSNLTDDFPTLKWILGGARFHDLVVAYLTAHPPRTWNLQRLGSEMLGYLDNEPRWNTDRLVGDACRLEWAFMEAFDAADADPLDLAPLAEAAEDAVSGARITFHPSLRRIAAEHPVHELREAVRRGEAVERPAASSTRIVVWRDTSFVLRSDAVDPLAFELLNLLAEGTPLGRACEEVAARLPPAKAEDLGQRVGGWFQHWTANGWVSAIRLA